MKYTYKIEYNYLSKYSYLLTYLPVIFTRDYKFYSIESKKVTWKKKKNKKVNFAVIFIE